jgi:DNA polymerase III subunit delta'
VANLRPLDAWGEVWQGLTRLQDETERFALDKRQALVQGLGLLSAGKMP